MKRVFGVLLLTAACGGPSAPAGGSPSAPPGQAATSPSPTAATYRTARDLYDALAAAGYSCGTFNEVESPTYATSLAQCGNEVTLSVYATEGQENAALGSLQAGDRQLGAAEHHYVAGPLWLVNAANASDAALIAGYLHGMVE